MQPCGVCGGAVAEQSDGTLFPHGRYADGAGPLNGQPHTIVPCEGGGVSVWESDSIAERLGKTRRVRSVQF